MQEWGVATITMLHKHTKVVVDGLRTWPTYQRSSNLPVYEIHQTYFPLKHRDGIVLDRSLCATTTDAHLLSDGAASLTGT